MARKTPPGKASRHKPTMRDVADLAGVSSMTVSRVIAQPGLVADATRERVNAVIKKLGYVPDLIASSLSSKKSAFIALIVPTLNNINFAETGGGLTEALRCTDYHLLIGYTNYRLTEEEALVRAMLSRRPAGIVLTGGHHSETTVELLRAARIPVVEVWDLPEQPIGHVVGFSNFQAGRAMTRRLIERGYRRIVFLASPANEPGFCDFRGEDRLAGHQAAMQEAGLDAERVIRPKRGPVSFTQGAEGMAQLLADYPDADAVFGVADPVAVGAMMECRRRGIEVPDRMGIAGFGDFEVGGQIVPSLTTVRVDCTGIGARTGALLLNLLDSLGPEPRDGYERIDLGFEVIERQSTAGTGRPLSSERVKGPTE